VFTRLVAEYSSLLTTSDFSVHATLSLSTGWAKNWTVLRVDNFALVNRRKACNMSNVSKFSLEKNNKTCMLVQYAICNFYTFLDEILKLLTYHTPISH